MVSKENIEQVKRSIDKSEVNVDKKEDESMGNEDGKKQAMNYLAKLESLSTKALIKASIVQRFLNNTKDMKVDKDVYYAFLDAVDTA